ncbi:hypothetical protein AMTRI_Chr09g22730 [Amborella trichopoda]
MAEKPQVDVHYMNAGPRGVIEDNFGSLFGSDNHIHIDLALSEILQNQEVLIQTSSRNNENVASMSNGAHPNPDQSSGGSRSSEDKDLQVKNDELQLAIDEALARSLLELELEDQLIDTSLNETVGTHLATVEPNAEETNALAVRQDDVDPDNMSYEELVSLGEAIGTQSRGLSDELISFLPTSKYKHGGFFSKNNNHDPCVICHMEYKKGDRLITLPCQHHYHSECVTRWLKENKLISLLSSIIEIAKTCLTQPCLIFYVGMYGCQTA